MAIKCIVKDCDNWSDEGHMTGEICTRCIELLKKFNVKEFLTAFEYFSVAKKDLDEKLKNL